MDSWDPGLLDLKLHNSIFIVGGVKAGMVQGGYSSQLLKAKMDVSNFECVASGFYFKVVEIREER